MLLRFSNNNIWSTWYSAGISSSVCIHTGVLGARRTTTNQVPNTPCTVLRVLLESVNSRMKAT